MPSIKLTANLETHPWTELNTLRAEGKVITAMGSEAQDLWLGGLPAGTRGGLTSVAIAVGLPDGSYILTETSLMQLATAVDALRAAYQLK